MNMEVHPRLDLQQSKQLPDGVRMTDSYQRSRNSFVFVYMEYTLLLLVPKLFQACLDTVISWLSINDGRIMMIFQLFSAASTKRGMFYFITHNYSKILCGLA
jgi:hypothetical protein